MSRTIVWWLFVLYISSTSASEKPNIIVIVADDMGFNDVGFHGNDEIHTPNIDALAYNGVILNNHYTQALCTPSRSAFLTGKYPIHLGMQHLVILESEPWGLPLNETLLPQHLKRNGYVTHAIGKWHLGFFKKKYTPTFRGFDTHFGYWQGLQDYYEHTVHATYTWEKGYDMRKNMSVDYDAKGKYSTTLFTKEATRLIREHDTNKPMFMYFAHLAPHSGNDNDPLQAPDEEIAKFVHIQDPERRIYAAMVSMLDQSVGEVIAALREKRMLENSIILFMSDNGAQPEGIHANHGSNYPLRGVKNSAWEGGTRNLAAIWSPLIKHPQRVSEQFMHISDWLPTFFSAAGLNKSELPTIDGMDMWGCISEGSDSPRTELLYNIDDITNYGGVRIGDWKYMYGSTNKGKADGWYGSIGRNTLSGYDVQTILTSKVASSLAGLKTYEQIRKKYKKHSSSGTEPINKEKILYLRNKATVKCVDVSEEFQSEDYQCDLLDSPCLFNITNDPCERVNLAKDYPVQVQRMEQAISRYRETALPPRNVPRDPNADPLKWNNTWINWADYDDSTSVFKEKVVYNSLSPLSIGLLVVAVVAVLFIIAMLIKLRVKSSTCCEDESKGSCLYGTNLEEAVIGEGKKENLFESKELQTRIFVKEDFRTIK